jgi:hypothetical protein
MPRQRLLKDHRYRMKNHFATFGLFEGMWNIEQAWLLMKYLFSANSWHLSNVAEKIKFCCRPFWQFCLSISLKRAGVRYISVQLKLVTPVFLIEPSARLIRVCVDYAACKTPWEWSAYRRLQDKRIVRINRAACSSVVFWRLEFEVE